VDENLRSFSTKIGRWREGSLRNKPSLPGFKPKDNRNKKTVEFNNQQITVDWDGNTIRFGLSKEMRDKFETDYFGGFRIKFNPSSLLHKGDPRELRLVHKNGRWKAHLVVEVDEPDLKDTGHEASADIGINNLLTLSFSNSEDQLVFSGKKYKSIRHYFDKKVEEAQRATNKYSKEDWSERLSELYRKRGIQLNHIAHKLTKQVTDELDSRDIDTLYIGDLTYIREGQNRGSRGNKNLHEWFFKKLTSLLRYKLRLRGIRLEKVNERGTSSTCCLCDSKKCSSRQKSAYFCECMNKQIHSDVNGAVNILKKHYSGTVRNLPEPTQIMDKMAYPVVLTWNDHKFRDRSELYEPPP
jgi:putative transposase